MWSGSSAPAVRYEFRIGPRITPAHETYDGQSSAGIRLVGKYVVKSPFDGAVSLF
ncbi:MAG: hypothetical protein FJ095_04070 [Deltaproteobacteria bacterium]|nr:hypothetical protein [Deltaproteobacteria bacterium]